jgi:hypothetical protein
MICALHQILFGNEIKKNEMGETYGTYGRQERYIQGVGREA